MSHRIMIVEDDPDIASVLVRGLGAAGHQTRWAETREAAAALAPGFDAAIIDMMLGEDSSSARRTTSRGCTLAPSIEPRNSSS